MRSDHRFEPSARAELAPASAARQANRAKKHRARRAHSTEFFAAAGWGNSWGIVGYCTLSSAGDWVSDSEAHKGKTSAKYVQKGGG